MYSKYVAPRAYWWSGKAICQK